MSPAVSSRPTVFAIAFARNPILIALTVCLLSLTFCIANPASTVYAKKQKRAKSALIKILSTPGGLPIEIDGKSEGETITDYRSFNLGAGLHTVVITLPGGAKWIRKIDLQARKIKCVTINFRPQGNVELGDVGTIRDCGEITSIPQVPYWKRAAAKGKGKK
jgi:hypothetical protein